MSDIAFENSRCTITKNQFKTKSKTYKVANIEKTSHKYSFLFLLPIGLFLMLFTFRFSLFLYYHEIIIFTVVSIISVFVSVTFGSLTLHSKNINETALMGILTDIKKIRVELDSVVSKRED